MDKLEKKVMIEKLINEADLSVEERRSLLFYLQDHQDLIKQMLKELVKFSKANNVMPFEYPEWLCKASELMEL